MGKQPGTAKTKVGACVPIDGAQGREYSIIIFSLVRCNGTSQIGFLDDFRRLNASITHARKDLIVLGSQRTLLTYDSDSI